jgi:hypothetical protein
MTLLAAVQFVEEPIWQPYIQVGFAMAFLVMTGMLWWKLRTDRVDRIDVFDKLLGMQEKMNAVIDRNTSAYHENTTAVQALNVKIRETDEDTRKVREALMSKPCILLRDPDVAAIIAAVIAKEREAEGR